MPKILKVLCILTVAALMFCPLYFLSAGHLDWQPVLEKAAPEGAEAFSLHYIGQVRAHKFDDALKDTDTARMGSEPKAVLSKAADFFPTGEAKSIKMVGVNFVASPAGETAWHLLFEYEFASGWIGVETALSGTGAYKVESLTAWALPDSAEHLNRFTFERKGYMHYLILALAVVLLLFDLLVFIRALLVPGLKHRWLWCLFVLVGIFQISFNWTTGQFEWLSAYDRQGTMYDFFYIGLPVVQFFQMAYGPLVLRFTLPVGAMLFLARYPLRRR